MESEMSSANTICIRTQLCFCFSIENEVVFILRQPRFLAIKLTVLIKQLHCIVKIHNIFKYVTIGRNSSLHIQGRDDCDRN